MAINSLSASSNGISGLASGLDTESMVEAMLSGTQSKIDTTNQKITQLEYKQELYRDVITDLKTFQDTYFTYSSATTNLRSQSYFQTKAATTTSDCYTVTATSSATVGNFSIDSISSLATTYKQSALQSASSIITGTIDEDAIEELKNSLSSESLTFMVDDNSVDISLADLAGKTSLNAASVINDALEAAGISGSVEYLNGSFTFTAEDSSSTLTIKGDDTALELIGGSVVSETGSATFGLDTDAVLPSLTITIDSVSKTVTFNPLDESTSIADQLNNAIASAFGSGITVAESDGKISITASNASRKITVKGDDDALDALGLKSGVSNKIALNTAISDNYFATPILGQTQSFSINGVDFSFSSDKTISSIINAINSSDAGVTVTYSSTTDKFTIASSTTGERGDAFEITQSEGNLMTALFGITPSGNTTGETLTMHVTEGTLPQDAFSYDGGTVNININGSNTALTITGSSFSSAEDFVDALNDALLNQFGSDDSDTANVYFSLSEDGTTVSLKTTEDYTAYIYDDSLSVLGFDIYATSGTTLAELDIENDVSFNVNGTELTFDSSTSISDMLDAINAAAGSEVATFNETKAYIRIAGVDIPMDFIDYSGKLFGATEGTLGVDTSAESPTTEDLFSVTQGSNAVITVDGVEVERSSNSFTLDGVSFTLTGTTDEASTVTVNQDTDTIYDTVVQFIEDYNTLVNSVNELLDADATYKDYDPLTTAQEDEMTDAQIEKWQEKAKEGLLRNDSTLTGVMSSLRRCLYTKPEGSLALYDLGITTSYFGTKDNLVIDDTSELKAMIAENPEAIMKLFTDTESGLSTMLNEALDDAVSTSTVSPGSLVRISGATGKTDTSSSIYKQVRDLEDTLDKLEDKYESEYERYWSKFNSMEELISEMNSTSSWLTSMMSS